MPNAADKILQEIEAERIRRMNLTMVNCQVKCNTLLKKTS